MVRQRQKGKHRGRKAASGGIRQRRSLLVLFLLLLVWSICLGWGLAQATDVTNQTNWLGQLSGSGTVDPVPSRYQLGQQLYLENCSTCHIGLPPAVLPSETWRNLLQDEQHYGTRIQPLIAPSVGIVWDYLQNFSRSHLPRERVPYRVSESRYFKALHPRVKLPRTFKITNCATCHPSAAQFNFQSLTPEWENSP